MTPKQMRDGYWIVVNDAGEHQAGPFSTEAEAEAWIGQQERARPQSSG